MNGAIIVLLLRKMGRREVGHDRLNLMMQGVTRASLAVNTCGTIAGEALMPGYHRAVIWSKNFCDP